MRSGLWQRFNNVRRKLGLVGTLRYAAARALGQDYSGKFDVFAAHAEVVGEPFGDAAGLADVKPRTINWLVPDFGVGSGGHINIFRFIRLLERAGYENRIAIIGHTHFRDGEVARASIRRHFSDIEATVGIGRRGIRPAQFTMATSWPTAYALRDFRATREKLYFVQDYEPYFYPHGSDYWLAAATYDMGFTGITAGDWLADKLTREHGMRASSIGFSFDRDLYRPVEGAERKGKRVFFYARPVTPRRAFELGVLAMNEVAKRRPDVTFVLAGWDTSNVVIPFRHEPLGNVSLVDLPAVYSGCDLALVLSATNLSLLPLELMACGCPVVSNRGANVEWLLDDSNSLLCDATPTALAEGMLAVLDDAGMRARLAEAGQTFANSTSWEAEGQKLAGILAAIGDGKP